MASGGGTEVGRHHKARKMCAKTTAKRQRRPPIAMGLRSPPGEGEGEGDTDPVLVHNPLLAYPRALIDPGGEATRDEGEARLPHVRAALYQLQREHAGLCAPAGACSLVAALTPATRLHGAAHAALFQAEASWKPRVCLVAPTAHTFAPDEADAMREEERVQCIPIADDPHGCVAFPNWPRPPPKRVVVHFDARRIGIGAAATVQFERTGYEQVTMRVTSSTGERRALRGAVAHAVVEKLFAASWATVLATPKLMPSLPGELPHMLMDEVADFWQRHVRAHVVASVCAPDDATRPLAFASMRARLEGQQHKRAVVRCTLHRSSAPCACELWKLKSMHKRMPTERWVGSEVELSLSMCGRKLGESTRLCPLHGAATPDVPQLPTICCHGTVASLQCSHQTQNRRTHAGLLQTDMRLTGMNVRHAQVLIASCMRCADAVAPLLGKAPPEKVVEACDQVCREARRKLDQVTRDRAVSGTVVHEDEMQERDMLAHDLLVEGGVRQYERPSTRELVLAKMGEDGSAAVLNAGDGAELAETHLGLFPPPLKTRKRKAKA